MQSYEPVTRISNVSTFNTNLLISIIFDLHSTL